MTSTAEILKVARDLIAKPENWTKGSTARDLHGFKVPAISDEAKSFNCIGAILRVSDGDFIAANKAVLALKDKIEFPDLSAFNDLSEHSAMLVHFSKAIKAAEGEQS